MDLIHYSDLKTKINVILPITLAVILPGLSIFANSGLDFRDSLGIFQSWSIASVILYLLWYILWYLWDIKTSYKRWWFIAGMVLAIAAILSAFYILIKTSIDFNGLVVLRLSIVTLMFLTIQYAMKAQNHISKLMLEKEQIQTENYRAQLKALRAKVDPHFLFNSLNTLRTMVRHQNSKSEQFVMSLSDFYRQTLKQNESIMLKFSEELAILQSYLFLMKSRNEEAVGIDIQIDQQLHHHQLPALALQTVVENCFKHNSMTSKMPLQIQIRNTDDYYIEVSNNVQPKIGEPNPSGMGLDMLRRRYELMKIKRGVIVEETPDRFIVKIKLV
jgi:sensor histidine kinase YesM